MPKAHLVGASLATAMALGACSARAAAQCEADKLHYPGSQAASPWFGTSVAMFGDLAVVGAPLEAEGGSAYVYRRLGPWSWALEQQLRAADPAPFDHFGAAAASADVLLVSAAGADGAGRDSGAAYVFRYDGAAWVQEQKLVPTDGAEHDRFGQPAIAGDRALIGAPGADAGASDSGAAYLFRFDGSQWVQEQKLVPSVPEEEGSFGSAVALDQGRAIVAAPRRDALAGAVFVFEFDDVLGRWRQTQTLVTPGPPSGALFGSDISLDDDRLIVGALGETADDAFQAGAGYIFAFDADRGEWVFEGKLAPARRGLLDNYGAFVAIAGDVALLGKNPHSPEVPAPPTLFTFDGQEWLEAGELERADGGGADNIYGGAVAMSSTAALVGSRIDRQELLPGAAFAFNIAACLCPADLDGDGDADVNDFFLYLDLFEAGDPRADITGDGAVDVNDFFAYLDLFEQGC